MKTTIGMKTTLLGLSLSTLFSQIACQSKIQTPRTGLTISSVATENSTTIQYTAPSGTPYNTVILQLGSDFAATNFCSGKTVLGISGSATCNAGAIYLLSTTSRNAGISPFPANTSYTTSLQLTQLLELNTYGQALGGLDLPVTGGYLYRDIPDRTLDDDGYTALTVRPAPRPSTVCGLSGSISTRIQDCTSKNASTTPWNGSTHGHQGETTWNLVTNSGSNKEVWQDSSTGLLWSSVAPAAINWCQATGNTQYSPLILTQVYNTALGTPMVGNGTISNLQGGPSSTAETVTIAFSDATTFTVTAATCTGGSLSGALTGNTGDTVTYSVPNVCSFTLTAGATPFAANDTYVLSSTDSSTYGCHAGGPLQSASPISYCAEATGLSAGFGTDNWTTGSYDAGKGGMGANSTDKIRWRSPTLYDYERADVDGIRNVMPDMGNVGTQRPAPDGSTAGTWEWSATSSSSNTINAQAFNTGITGQQASPVTTSYNVRCVGR